MTEVIYRALIVDDELLVREAAARAMAAHSFWCDTASDGAEAIEKLRKNSYDLVVTDLRMPNKHGHSLTLEIMSSADPAHVVVLTGVSSQKVVDDLRQRGVEDIFYKPVDFQQFARQMLALFDQQAWGDDLVRHESSQGQRLLHQIEDSLELFSLCIPAELDAALSEGVALLENPAPAVIEFMHRLWNKHSVKEERRGASRISLLSPAVAVPINKDLKIQGEAFPLTFCDVSPTGGCLLNTRSISAQYVALKWRSAVTPNCFLKLAMRVARCQPVGPFYEIAGDFIMHD